MPWFKVDDTLHSHPKTRKAGLAAMGLWGVAGSYCMAYKTDGDVPRWFVETWPQGTRRARELVEVGLWIATETGFQFHDWSDFQPTADEIERDRESARERQRRRREKLRSLRDGHDDVTPNVTRDVSSESQDPVPARPGPALLTTSAREDAGEADAATPHKKSSSKKPATHLPDDWQPTPAHAERAAKEGIDLAREVERFRSHAEANDRRQVNWNASFTTWLLGVPEWQKSKDNVRQLRTDDQGRTMLPPLPPRSPWGQA